MDFEAIEVAIRRQALALAAKVETVDVSGRQVTLTFPADAAPAMVAIDPNA